MIVAGVQLMPSYADEQAQLMRDQETFAKLGAIADRFAMTAAELLEVLRDRSARVHESPDGLLSSQVFADPPREAVISNSPVGPNNVSPMTIRKHISEVALGR